MTARSQGSGYQKFKSARNKLRKFFPGVFVLGKAITLAYSKRSFLVQAGYFESVRTKTPCRRDGSPIPWMNYGMVEFLEQRLHNELTLFEYGSGNSTLFFAERVRDVVSVECDEGWYGYVKDSLPANVKLMFVAADGDSYVNAIDDGDRSYDIVVVDAEQRVNCMINAPQRLSAQGVILLDDASRDQYGPGIADLRAAGFKQLDFNGLKPGGVNTYRTTVFYRDGNCFGI